MEIGTGNLKDAIAQFHRGTELAPDNAVAYYDLGFADARSDRTEEARTAFEKALSIEPTADTYNELGNVLLLEGRFDPAAAMYEKSIALDSNNYSAWGNLAVASRWSHDKDGKAAAAYAQAIKLAEQAHQKNREDPMLLLALADYYASTGKSAEARTLLRQAQALAPGDPPVEYEAGETYETLGERAQAIGLITKAVGSGYDAYELGHNPDLAALRADPAFAGALRAAQRTKK
jgi:Flp pilus assembly protein TadD